MSVKTHHTWSIVLILLFCYILQPFKLVEDVREPTQEICWVLYVE